MKSIIELRIGDRYDFTKRFTDADVVLISCITESFNPLYISEEYAKKGPYGRRLVPEDLVTSLVLKTIREILPEPDYHIAGHTFEIVAPVFLGEALTASAKVIGSNWLKREISLSTRCVKEDGTLVLRGKTEITFDESKYTQMGRMSCQGPYALS